MSGEKPVSEIIIPAFFLNLDDRHWWEFKEANTGKLARVECHTSGCTVTVPITVGGEVVVEQVLEAKESPDEQTGQLIRQYTLLESRIAAQQLIIRWQGGLILPFKWALGIAVFATSQPGANPCTGNPVKVAATLVRVGELKPPAPPLFGVEIKQTIQDVRSGKNLSSANMYFAGSRGLVYATGQVDGKFFVLQQTSWYGQH